MFFNSPIFLFFFLPIAALLYHNAKTNYKNIVLLFASVFFYAWGEGRYAFLLIISICLNYYFGLLIARNKKYDDTTSKNRKLLLYTAVTINVVILIAFKYLNFIVSNISVGSILELGIPLPMGISFFTFKAISYIIDIYKEKVEAEYSIINAGLYISLFPQLIAGPISRYPDISPQLTDRVLNIHQISSGIQRFIIGLAKKVIIADGIGVMVDQIFALKTNDLTFSLAWIGSIGYTLQIYFDFSGYTDMAIGLGRIFGFEFAENFNYPYISKSIREFWRRWHMTLSSWFRDYLYIPLGGNRSETGRTYLNLIIVFLICGLWHGASWCFVIWGLWHGAFLVLERLNVGKYIQKIWAPFRHYYTLLIVIVGWVFFRSESLAYAIGYIKVMFGLSQGSGTYYPSLYLDNYVISMLFIGIIFSIPSLEVVKLKINSLMLNIYDRLNMNYRHIKDLINLFIIFCVYIICLMQLAGKTLNSFIYFRF